MTTQHTDRELMQQALEALEEVREWNVKQAAARTALRERLAQPEQEPVAWLSQDEARLALWQAMHKRADAGNPTDDKLVLVYLQQQGLWIGKYTAPQQPMFHLRSHGDVSAEELERLAQPEQEPDMSEQGRTRSAILGNNVEAMMDAGLPFLTALGTTLKVYDHKCYQVKAQPAPQQEPYVHVISGRTADELWLETGRLRSELADLKAQQKPRQWQGLTDGQLNDLYATHHDKFGQPISADHNGWGYERAIEAKLKEKNA